MENTKYGKRREGRWTPIRAKAQDTRANPTSWETHLVRKRWGIGLLRALSLRIIMMMNGGTWWRRGALVESIAFNRRVVGSTPALAAMYRDLGKVLYLQLPVRFGVKLRYSIRAVVGSAS